MGFDWMAFAEGFMETAAENIKDKKVEARRYQMEQEELAKRNLVKISQRNATVNKVMGLTKMLSDNGASTAQIQAAIASGPNALAEFAVKVQEAVAAQNGKPLQDNEIETILFASTGNATDYGDLAANSKGGSGTGSRTRGIAFLGNGGNVINYFALESTGSGVDFGDATTNATSLTAACGSPTRAVVGGGSPASNSMGFVTISTLGNTQDFGDLTDERGGLMAASNPVRGLFAGGFAPSDGTNLIDYITIATLGNATNFGDLTRRTHYAGSGSSSTRMVIGGGDDHPSGGNYSNVIDYVQIMSTGDAVDFGDLIQGRRHVQGASNANGGL